MKYIICDDNENFARHLKECILDIEPGGTFALFNSLSEIRANIDYVVSDSDAIFFDIRLKDGNGIEGAKEIILKYPHLKLVYITGYGEEYFQSIFENPVDVTPVAFLAKPIQKKYLVNALEKINQPTRETRFLR